MAVNAWFNGAKAAMIILSSIFAFLSTVVVALRFWAKTLRRSRPLFAIEDYMALVALLLQHIFYVCAFITTVKSPGIGIVFTPYTYKLLLVMELAYGFSAPLIKLSVLVFYLRVFPTQLVQRGSRILGALAVAWCVAIQITNLLSCRPLYALWTPTLLVEGKAVCIDTPAYYLGNSVANAMLDIGILALPLRDLARLQMPIAKRAGLMLAFALGGL